jgi:hypothetical protein
MILDEYQLILYWYQDMMDFLRAAKAAVTVDDLAEFTSSEALPTEFEFVPLNAFPALVDAIARRLTPARPPRDDGGSFDAEAAMRHLCRSLVARRVSSGVAATDQLDTLTAVRVALEPALPEDVLQWWPRTWADVLEL